MRKEFYQEQSKKEHVYLMFFNIEKKCNQFGTDMSNKT